MGARALMIAWNVSLHSNDLLLAKKIAARVRESGFVRNGQRIPGRFKGLRAIGWRIKEYGCVQVSMNLYDIDAAPLAAVWEFIAEHAAADAVSLKESELIGLIPCRALQAAGSYWGESEEKKQLAVAISRLQFRSFRPEDHILEYNIQRHIDRWRQP